MIIYRNLSWPRLAVKDGAGRQNNFMNKVSAVKIEIFSLGLQVVSGFKILTDVPLFTPGQLSILDLVQPKAKQCVSRCVFFDSDPSSYKFNIVKHTTQ